MLFLLLSTNLIYALNANQILNQVEKKINPQTAKIKLEIKTPSNDKVVEYFSKENESEVNTLFKVLAPNEEEGTAILALDKRGTEELYFYIQAIGARKVAVNQKKGSFLQTEYNYFEILDMVEGKYNQKFQSSIQDQNENGFVLKLTPKNKLNQYQYLLLYVNNKYLPQKIEFYKGQKKYKVWKVQKLAQNNGLYVPKKSVMVDLINNQQTEITFAEIDYNVELNDLIFSVRYLKR